jgi:hypothetical protein
MGKEAKSIVRLSSEERGQLEDLVARGRVAKATRQRALVLLQADLGPDGPGKVDIDQGNASGNPRRAGTSGADGLRIRA